MYERPTVLDEVVGITWRYEEIFTYKTNLMQFNYSSLPHIDTYNTVKRKTDSMLS
jgi:hypothetical protein